MRKFLPLLAVMAYAAVAYVPVPGMYFGDSMRARASEVFRELAEATSSVKPDVVRFIGLSRDAVYGAVSSRIESAIESGKAQICGDLGEMPTGEGAPTLGDWTIFCLARVLKDPDRCDRISATIVPDLRGMCTKALSSL